MISKRSFVNFFRDPALFINEVSPTWLISRGMHGCITAAAIAFQIFGDIFMALLIGAIYFQLSKDASTAIQDRLVLYHIVVSPYTFQSYLSLFV